MRKRPRERLSDQLRQYITESELSRNAIAKAAEVDPSQLHRFVYRTGRLTTDSSLDRVCSALKLRLVQDDD